jgi:hypothetical protein
VNRLQIVITKMVHKLVMADIDDEETQQMLGGEGTRPVIVQKHSGNSTVWKVLTLLLVGVVILFATDSVQLKNSSKTKTTTTNGDDDNNNDNNNNNNNNNIEPSNSFAENVEFKNKPVPSPTTPAENEPVPTTPADTTPVVSEPTTTTTTTSEAASSSGSAPEPAVDEPAEDSTPAETVPVPSPPENTPPPPVATETTPAETETVPVPSPETSGDGTATASKASLPDPPIVNEADRRTYPRRGQPMGDADRQAMIGNWGSWTFVDDKERPQHDYYKDHPNRDIPRTEFPSNAWQIDTDHLSKFLPQGIALAQRAQEAILAEYGKTEGTWEERAKMFTVEHIPEEELETAPGLSATGRRGKREGRNSTYQGGWTTPTSWEGLKKRILHAIMTEDSFVFAMGGHSAAAGHGNHFSQSYSLQVQWILESVFARLGVRHEARNFGNGGLGTVHNGIAAASLYGPDIDVLMWDSGMTEGPEGADLAARQALLGGIKVPVRIGSTTFQYTFSLCALHR